MRQWTKNDKLATLIIFVSILALAVPVTLKIYLGKKPTLDEQTLCPTSGEKERVAVLVDKSDKWGRADVTRVRDLLQSIYLGVRAQGRLTIYSITGDGRKSTDVNRVFDMCNPGTEAECNVLYQNCRKVKKIYESAFDEPLHRLAASLILPGESSSSPILETVGAMVKDSKGEILRLHIISDFMENGAYFRFYDLVPLDEEMVAQYQLPRKIKITVEAYLIQRRIHPMPLQIAVQRAWTGYFEKQGIQTTFRPIFVSE